MEVLSEYREFLAGAAKAPAGAVPGSIRPSRDIDALWHQHILNTESYISDCMSWFGHVVHHVPMPVAQARPTSTQPMAMMKGDCSASGPAEVSQELAADCSAGRERVGQEIE